MKKFFWIFIILLLSVAVSVFAGTDRFNQGKTVNLKQSPGAIADNDNVCGYYETATTVTYVFKATWIDSSDHLHSKPFFIADMNAVDGYCRAITNAASDVNPVYHFSYDNKNTWTTTTPHTLDALSSTAVGDTIGIELAVNDITGFHTGVWMVVEFQDGSTALNDDEYCIWTAVFTKDGTYLQGSIELIAEFATGSYTNP